MSVWVILGLLAAVVVVVMLARKGGSTSTPAAPQASSRSAKSRRVAAPVTPSTGSTDKPKEFRGLAFVAGEQACEAATNLNGKTYQREQAPTIPLAQCDTKHCQCHFRDVQDRRKTTRRINADRRTDIRFGDDRRSGRDRRKDADAWNRAHD